MPKLPFGKFGNSNKTTPNGRNTITNREERDAVIENPLWENDQGIVYNREGKREIGLQLFLPPDTSLSNAALYRMWEDIHGVLHNGIPEGERGRFIIAGTRARPQVTRINPGNGHPLARQLRLSAAQNFETMRLRNQLLEWTYYFTCTVNARNFSEEEAMTPDQYRRGTETALRLRARFAQLFSFAGIAAKEMDENDVHECVYRYLNPDQQSAAVPPFRPASKRKFYTQDDLIEHPDIYSHTWREQLLGSEIVNTTDHLQIGRTYVNVTTMRRTPDITDVNGVTGIISGLNREGVHRAYIITDYHHEPFQKMLAKVRGKARQLNAAATDTEAGYIDPETRAGLADTEDFLTYLSRTNQHIFSTSCAVITMEDSAEKMILANEAARAALAPMGGGSPVISTAQNIKQYLMEYMPFSGMSGSTKFKVLEENSADFFPLTGPWEGTFVHEEDIIEGSLFLNRTHGVTRYNLFSQYNNNYSAVIVAGSGRGKTVLANYLMTDIVAQGGIATLVDRGKGYDTVVNLLDGVTISIGPGSEHTINPFHLGDHVIFPDERKLLGTLAILRSMVPPLSESTQGLEDQLIEEAIARTYQAGRDERPMYNPDGTPRLNDDGTQAFEIVRDKAVYMSDFHARLSNITEMKGSPLTQEMRGMLQTLSLQFGKWVGDGMYANFVDGDTTIDITHPIMNFEVGELEKSGPLATVGMLLIGELTWERIYLYADKPKLVVFDEAWKLLRNAYARSIFEEFFRRGRHVFVGAMAVSQSLRDFDEMPGILSSCSNFFLSDLPGEDALVADRLGLNSQALAIYKTISGGTANGLHIQTDYKEFFAWNRMQDGVHGDVIRVYMSPLQNITYSSNPVHKAKRAAAIKAHGGNTLEGLLSLVRDKQN